jgi:hypothetical protein
MRVHGALCRPEPNYIQQHKTHTSAHSPYYNFQVAAHFAALTKGTPMFDCVGLMPSADRPSNTVTSYCSAHDTLGAKTKSYILKYQQFVLEYAVEWEKIICTRVNNGLKSAETLRRELDHYQKKVEAMRLVVNSAMAKGKNVKSEQQEKLRRNEEKLISSKQTYNNVATDLCILMEEVVERSWRDLHPLLIKCAQFDQTLSNDESTILAALTQVVSELKQCATVHGISPQPRLKDLASLKPELLSTRPGGVLAIESEPGSIFGTQALPPGSVAPQGMGGFPVAVQADAFAIAPDAYVSTTSYNASYEPSSANMGMMTISQSYAPAPTMEDVYGANSTYPSSTRSAPNSGNLPPLHSFGRASSFHSDRGGYNTDNDSVYSGASTYTAPQPYLAPMMAPPLPPSAPPPLPPAAYNPASYNSSGYPPLAETYQQPPPQSWAPTSGNYNTGSSNNQSNNPFGS